MLKMWTSSSCDNLAQESIHQKNNEYTPPEKKPKAYTPPKTDEDEALLEALQGCKNQELGIEEASIIYGIPKRTLRTKLKNNNFSVIDEKYRVFVLPVFPSQAEIDLVEILKSMITSQITLTPIEVRRLGYELVCKKYKVSNLPEEKNCVLGQRWYREFTAKYPHTDMNHSYLHCQQDKSRNFYQALEDLVTANEIDSSRIFAVDAVELKFRASSMEDLKIFHKRKTIYTDAKAICCTNPNGCYVPPIFLKPAENINSDSSFSSYNDTVNDKIFNDNQGNVNLSKSEHLGTVCNKLKNLCNTSLKKLPTSEDLASIQKQIKIHLNKKLQPMSEENEEELREKLYEQFSQLKNKIISKYESSLNEVSNDIFFEWFQTFVKFVKPTPLKKVLLLLSEQNHVKCFKTLELAKASGVLFLALPPHTVHKIYPLDGFTMSLNRNLSTCAKRWLGKNPDFKVQQVPLHLLFKKGYSETVNPIIAKNGFLYSGIWPINKNIFESTELGGESLLFQKNSLTLVKKNCLKSSTGNESENNFLLPGITTESDLQKLCRVCMKEKMYMKPLFESSPSFGPNYHGKKISEITNAPVLPDDGLPASFCQYCLVQLIDTTKIKSTLIESHKKQLNLREALHRMYYEGKKSDDKWFLSQFRYEFSQQNHAKIINKILAKNFDINSICRICMGEKPLMTSIFFKPQDGSSFCTETCRKIMEISQCQAQVHDGLSSSICPFCRASINKAYEFTQKVINSDKRFREIVTQIRKNN